MRHSPSKIKSLRADRFEAFRVIPASDLQLRRRQLFGHFAARAGEAFQRKSARLLDAMTLGERRLQLGWTPRFSSLRHTWGRLLDFSKNFIQSVVRESAL